MTTDTRTALLQQANTEQTTLQTQTELLLDACTRYLARISPDTKKGLFAASLSREQLASAYYTHTVALEKRFAVIEQSVTRLCAILRQADTAVFPEAVVTCDQILREYLILRAKLSEFSAKNEKQIRSEAKTITSSEAIRFATEFRAHVEHFLLFLQNHKNNQMIP